MATFLSDKDREVRLFHLVADLSITFKAFSSHSSRIMILIFLCLLAGMICCCYYSFNQATLVNKVAPAQDITSSAVDGTFLAEVTALAVQ